MRLMKVLILRFSSIGDVTQSLSIPNHIKNTYPDAEIDFLTKKEFEKIFLYSPHIHQVITIEKNISLRGLFNLSQTLSANHYTHVYDAHNNLRSNLLYFMISASKKLQRPMMRVKRLLLLQFKINLFEKPFSGQRDLLKPLEKWGIPFSLPKTPQLFLSSDDIQFANETLTKNKIVHFVILVPSAAHTLKRWPITHWDKLISLNPNLQFIVLAGPGDTFTEVLNSHPNVLNLTGKTSLTQSAALIQRANTVVANDTGMLHFAEQLGIPTIALMGPAPFGFPSRQSTKILERNLKCRPCSKHGQGPCINPIYHECLVSISPTEVSIEMNSLCS
jgi:ADP-heptose:LPS heptosyltransferase